MDRDCGPECQETLREIARFLDGELDPSVRAAVDRHLSSCDPCLEHAEFRKHLKQLIASRCGGDSMPGELLLRVKALIEIEGSPGG